MARSQREKNIDATESKKTFPSLTLKKDMITFSIPKSNKPFPFFLWLCPFLTGIVGSSPAFVYQLGPTRGRRCRPSTCLPAAWGGGPSTHSSGSGRASIDGRTIFEPQQQPCFVTANERRAPVGRPAEPIHSMHLHAPPTTTTRPPRTGCGGCPLGGCAAKVVLSIPSRFAFLAPAAAELSARRRQSGVDARFPRCWHSNPTKHEWQPTTTTTTTTKVRMEEPLRYQVAGLQQQLAFQQCRNSWLRGKYMPRGPPRLLQPRPRTTIRRPAGGRTALRHRAAHRTAPTCGTEEQAHGIRNRSQGQPRGRGSSCGHTAAWWGDALGYHRTAQSRPGTQRD